MTNRRVVGMKGVNTANGLIVIVFEDVIVAEVIIGNNKIPIVCQNGVVHIDNVIVVVLTLIGVI